jgi:hypothetical protein
MVTTFLKETMLQLLLPRRRHIPTFPPTRRNLGIPHLQTQLISDRRLKQVINGLRQFQYLQVPSRQVRILPGWRGIRPSGLYLALLHKQRSAMMTSGGCPFKGMVQKVSRKSNSLLILVMLWLEPRPPTMASKKATSSMGNWETHSK